MTEKKYEIFDLEAEIMSVWSTKDDLESITYRLMDDPDGPLTEDEIANVLDMNGKQVMSITNGTVNISDLAKGTYIINQNNTNAIFIKK